MILCRKTVIFILTLLLAHPVTSFSQQWVQTKGPGGGSVIRMAERSGVLFAATLGGVFRSTDNGSTWARSMNGIPDGGYMTVFAQTPTYIYTAGWSEGLFRSSDNGLTWTSVPITNVGSIFILSLYCIGEDIYIGCEGAGVVRSTNAGASFQLVNAGYPGSANVVAFAQLGQYLYTGLAGNGGSVGIYRTPLNTINWSQKFVGGIGDIAVKGTFLFITSVSGLYRSVDSGSTWAEPLPGFNNFSAFLTVYNGDIYTAKDGDGVYKSTNDGAAWTNAHSGMKPMTVFSFLPGTMGLYIGFERGVARTTNNAASWSLMSRGLTNTSITSLLSVGSRLYATARTIDAGSSDGVFFTDDAGEHWTPMDKGLLPNPQGKCIAKCGSNFILATLNYGLFVKKASDTAWVKPPGVPATVQVNTLISSGKYVLAGMSGSGELYRSSDSGLTWTQSNTGFNTAQGNQVYSFYEQSGVIYAGAFNALYKTTDYGLTWTNSSAGIYPGANITGITGIGNDLFAVDDHNLGIYKSTNGGASWFNINNGIPAIIKFNAIIANSGTLYAGGDLGVYRSTDSGNSWAPFNDSLMAKRNILSFSIHDNQLFLGTDETSVWRYGVPAPTNVALTAPGSETVSVFPNPTNGHLELLVNGYKGNALITVMNAIGQNVYYKSIHVDNNSTSAWIDISSQPPGMYSVILKTDKRIIANKIIVR